MPSLDEEIASKQTELNNLVKQKNTIRRKELISGDFLVAVTKTAASEGVLILDLASFSNTLIDNLSSSLDIYFRNFAFDE